jgi:uncharacterized protein (DUF362 family)/NAD-dependent dihydropyrimidine dehydrogenase PreA subunit
MPGSEVSLVRCGSYNTADTEDAVRRSIELLGGIGKFIKPNEKVLIKPNLLTDAFPDKGITTHPEVVRAVIRAIKPVTQNIFCGDSPSVWGERLDIEHVYETSGIRKVCEDEGVKIVYFTTPKLYRSYPLTNWLDQCDRLVSIPKFKTHGMTILTAGIKNLFGLVVGMNKMKIHYDHPRPQDLSRALVDLYEIRKPDLTILDGVIAMEGEGPGSGGILRPMNLIASSADALCLDIILSKIMGLLPSDIPTNKEAIQRGLAPSQASSIIVTGEGLKSFCVKDFKLPKSPSLDAAPKWFVDLFKQFLKIKITINPRRCRACGLCIKGCPAQAMAIEDNRVRIDDEKCLRCLCCQEVCPQAAIGIKKSFLMGLMEKIKG